MKKPWTDPNPQLGRPGIARQFAATEEQKPPGPGPRPAPQGDTADARRAVSSTGSRPRGTAPTIVKRSKGRGRVVLPKVMKASDLPPPAPKSKAKKKGGRPRTIGDDKPWVKAGVSKATWYRKQGRGR